MFDTISKRLVQGAGAAAGLLLLCTVASDALAIVFRYGIDSPLIWTEEAQRYFMVWVAFLGSASCVASGDHMAIDLFSAILPRWAQRLRRVGLLALTAAYCALLAWQGYPLAIENGDQLAPATGIPMTYPYLAVAVGGALMALAALVRLGGELFGRAPLQDAQP